MKRMTESRRDYLCEGGTQCARRVGGRVRLLHVGRIEGRFEAPILLLKFRHLLFGFREAIGIG